MIYDFMLLNSRGEQRQFYLTADDDRSLYKRILDTYGITSDKVTITRVFKETPDYRYEPYDNRVIDKNIDKATELYNKATKKRGQKKEDYIKKYAFKEVQIESVKDVSELMSKYKKVKVYYQPGKKRGTKEYYALVK